MSEERLVRTAALLGEEGVARLGAAHVLLVGLGGVGGHTMDALVRTGVGALTLCDFDRVSESNLNRQILADRTTVGRLKTEVAAEKCAKIADNVKICLHSDRLTPETVPALFDAAAFDFVVDAVDDVAVKVALAKEATRRTIPILSCLGTGNRLDPSALSFTDIYKTSDCPLARAVRTRLRREGVASLRVLVSREAAIAPKTGDVRVGSVAYVPAVAGLMLAAETVRLLLS